MYQLTCKIEIQGDKTWRFAFATSVEITRDTEQLTDTCTITLPKRMRWDGQASIPVNRGDRVKVWTGYDGNLELAFAGYVRDVGFKTPAVLRCEDEMYMLKQKPCVKKAYKAATLEQLLHDQGIQDFKVFGEQALGQFRVTQDTVASLLGRLKESGIRSFFRYEGGKAVLYCGVLFERGETRPSQVFITGVNLISDSSLEQRKADTMRIKVKAVSIMPDNKKIRVEAGDRDGETRTLHTYNKNKKELEAWANQEIKRLKRDGLTGSFTTFGYRLLDKLDTVGLRIDGVRMGVYQVKSNVIKFGTDGYRQEVTLGQIVGK